MITSQRSHVTAVALTHPGETGKNNEDRYSVTTYTVEPDEIPSILAVVSDGIGGHQAGEVAAQLTVDTTLKVLSASSAHEPVEQLRSAIIEAGRAVTRAAREKPELAGMGSTVAVIWIIGDKLYTATVGDSRIYLLREGTLHQLSIDHTWIQEALDHDIISPDEVKDHPNVHVLRRHIGGVQDPAVDTRLRLSADETDEKSESNQGLTLKPGDQLLACTDGLTDLVKNSDIRQTLVTKGPKEAAAQLVKLARERGGYDNITVVLMAVPTARRRSRLGRKIVPVVFAFGALLGLLGVALAAAWWFGLVPRPSVTPTMTPASAVATVFAPGSLPTDTSPVGEANPSQVPPAADTAEASATYTAFPLPTVPTPTLTPVPSG
jgi:serine/threonine protein phosphatase PrpC